MLGATENGSAVNQVQQYDEHNQSPEYFSFQQELPETDSKGSSMIRESNADPWDIPGLRVEVNEVDTVKQGYRLLWVPLSRAYDMETPFVSPSEMTMLEEKREENIVFEEEIEDENLLATESKPAEVKMYQSNLAKDGKRWTVVADTASLVGKESRKSLQLLQGLKGTHLVIRKMGKIVVAKLLSRIHLLIGVDLDIRDP
ncbi:hypothetical protein SADUNF_Sadunf17G0078900 [Salix dunnii]|uniref:Uncharacterized protein n=1 Tax=Salix dunnii TaxID=1413687 RepID=A0A835MJZ0_9ROSI|nr:hypothetical protein SADUNF_Sadunf17G0078900 [Salix dunnii]